MRSIKEGRRKKIGKGKQKKAAEIGKPIKETFDGNSRRKRITEEEGGR